MRFLIGLVCGVVLTIFSASLYDQSHSGALRPIVNWSNVADLKAYSIEYVTAHSDRFVKWLTFQY
jgi:hypothetical protein